MSMTTSSDRRIPLAPSEGWLTLGLVLLLCASLAWALDDSMLVLGRDAATDFLLWTAVAGVLAGFAGEVSAEHENPERRAVIGRRHQTDSLQRVGKQTF
jgi:hypothetical protein